MSEYYSVCGKVNFSVIHPTHITISVFEEQCLTQRFCKLLEKLHFNIKKNDNFFFTIVSPLELDSRLYTCLLLLRLVLHLHVWAVAEHKNEFCSK